MWIIDKIGIKSIKIALAVTISLFIGSLFKIGSPYLMALTSVIGIQSTMDSSVSNAKDMIMGTIIGVLAGIVTVKFISNDFTIMIMGVFVIIYLCNILKLQNSVVQANIIYFSIMLFPSPGDNALSVMVSTVIGVIVAIVVNLFISPFEIIYNLNKSYCNLRESIFSLCFKIFSNQEDIGLQEFNSQINLFKSLVKAYNSEYFKIKYKGLKINEIDLLFENIKGISFLIYTIVELRTRNISSDNLTRINKILDIDLEFLDYEESKYDYLFNFHIDKLLDYLENI